MGCLERMELMDEQDVLREAEAMRVDGPWVVPIVSEKTDIWDTAC